MKVKISPGFCRRFTEIFSLTFKEVRVSNRAFPQFWILFGDNVCHLFVNFYCVWLVRKLRKWKWKKPLGFCWGFKETSFYHFGEVCELNLLCVFMHVWHSWNLFGDDLFIYLFMFLYFLLVFGWWKSWGNGNEKNHLDLLIKEIILLFFFFKFVNWF